MGRAMPPRRTGRGERRRGMIVRFVREFRQSEGHSPSLRQIGDAVGLAASTVSYHVAVLEREGALRRGPRQPRTLTQPASSCAGPVAEADEVDVPLLGQIPAGIPAEAVELAEDTFRLPRRLVGHGTLFMLTVRGLDDRGSDHRR